MWATNTAQICVFFSTSVLGQKGTPPPLPPPHSTVQCAAKASHFHLVRFTVLWKIVWTAVTRRKPYLSSVQDWKYNCCPSVHRRKQSSMSSKLPHHFLFGWRPPSGSLVWAAPEFRRGFIPALKESLRFTWNLIFSLFTLRKVKWQHYGNVSILWKMIINSVIKIIGSCLNGFARNCFCSRGLVMCICFVGLFVSSVSELRVGHFLCESSTSDH